ncbi:hypothetical protein [Glutamicibacter ardleyensis]|uniref:hypothetical protein n=1 Tax=Glutamicibacter ardleyensis TaxID=225894 RepID=UPI0026AE6B03
MSAILTPPHWFRYPNDVAHLYVPRRAANDEMTSPNSDLAYRNLRYFPDVLEIVNAPRDKGGMAG